MFNPLTYLDSHPNVKKVAVVLAVFGSGCLVGRFSLPAKVVTKTQVQVVDHYIEHKDVDQKTDDKTTTIVTKKPDGTTTTETVQDDQTQDIDKSVITNDSTTTKTQEKTVTYDNQQWSVSALAAKQLNASGTAYGAMVERRILGPFHVGVFGLTNSTAGVSIGFSF